MGTSFKYVCVHSARIDAATPDEIDLLPRIRDMLPHDSLGLNYKKGQVENNMHMFLSVGGLLDAGSVLLQHVHELVSAVTVYSTADSVWLSIINKLEMQLKEKYLSVLSNSDFSFIARRCSCLLIIDSIRFPSDLGQSSPETVEDSVVFEEEKSLKEAVLLLLSKDLRHSII
jgi:hypothetical protein